ncbi:TPA: PTS glucose transporter subunit IIA [Clostridioides difficile]|uniref:PTS beta-glucoside transporter subunit IIBCA n=1 Tax=Clostridioides difficile TaxID=1496 RepID=UPI0007BC2597|nr:PTS transporter subunit IIBCA [Clostridioides difficile]EGT4184921.1 PTS beta-glucoside transporter subunit IIBCA [Clostridioides difficile]EGT4215967.1 PTS beta-glucoside transporter subunit IIBCA [Clostridioides difficile]MDL0335387.1 glucose PTS transporter subunit IIA [Clostridioides difficile]CZR72032.1 PTS system sucrose-specific transporter subunit IIABC [Clostridium difficile 630] [Clostridioides difficile]CZR76529.1 PTS system beta-glucoside-specific EIIBCA component [Clostridioide
MNKYNKIANELIKIIGEDNIISITHCATRLRVMVKDREIINDKKVEKVDEVKGVFFTSGQYQIILGTGIVNKVYAEVEKMGLKTLSKKEQDELVKNNETGFKKVMRTLADIFVPIIPVIAATGLFLGLKGCLFNDNVLGLFGMSSANIPLYIQTLVSVLTETAFAFLPAIIVWSAFKVFGGTPVIGLVIGLMLVSPILPNAYSVADPSNEIEAIMAFGFIPIVGCQGSVLTAIVTAFIGANLEKWFRKHMPNVLDLIFTPFFVMLITMLVILLGVGPIMHTIELKMVDIISLLIDLPLGIGGFIIGFTYPLAVITGLHHTYVMIETSLLANTGFNALITLCAMYGFANIGTCLAFMKKSKNNQVKQTAVGAMLSQLFGISEPVLFGIQLRYNLKPLIIMCASSGLGAAILSILHIQSNSYGLAVLPSYLMYIYDGYNLITYLLVSIFVVAFCFIVTCLFGVPKEAINEDEDEELVFNENNENFVSPAKGKIVALENVPDETFSKKMLGDGFAIDIIDGKIVSPISGKLETVFSSGHAFGIKGTNGEVLIHVGIDTVALNGDGFDVAVKQGDMVKQGDVLVNVDLKRIHELGKSTLTMVLFPDGKKVNILNINKDVKIGQRICVE